MGDSLTDRITQLGPGRARLALAAVGMAVLAVAVGVMYGRGVDDVEILATGLFVVVLLAFLYRGVAGGALAAVVVTAGYAALRHSVLQDIGGDHYAGLLATRGAAYLIFGLVGGWSVELLESSLDRLDLYDDVDDETGLYNAQHLLRLTDLETSRAQRYRTLFSIAVLEVPAAPLASLGGRRRRTVLRELGRVLAAGARNVDHIGHVRDSTRHRFVAVLPETASEGAEVFRHRFAERVRFFLAERGVRLSNAEVGSRTITYPGDDDYLAELVAALQDGR